MWVKGETEETRARCATHRLGVPAGSSPVSTLTVASARMAFLSLAGVIVGTLGVGAAAVAKDRKVLGMKALRYEGRIDIAFWRTVASPETKDASSVGSMSEGLNEGVP